ncbi:MAG: MBL fold metallo-hydrolase [bacterium]|nr:MBL fold metallo-hydrolase [bacterium]
MHCQVLSSGSAGNSLLLRAGDAHVLLDAGLPPREQRERLAEARIPFRGIEHLLITHAHLDHARSAGILAKRHDAVVHCPERMMRNRSVKRAPRLATIAMGADRELIGKRGDRLTYRAVRVPHDCEPTVAYRVDHGERRLVLVTDMGAPRKQVARELVGAHVLVLEFNHDERLLQDGPYAPALKKRVAGDLGHLSNAQAARMLEHLAGENLHTLVLAHLSLTNNTPELALEVAQSTLDRLGLGHVRVIVASQEAVGENLEV